MFTFRTKILLIILLSGLVPLFLVSKLTFSSAKEIFVETLTDQVKREAKADLIELTKGFSKYQSDLTFWVNLDLVRDGVMVDDTELKISRFLEGLKNHFKFSNDLFCFNQQGKIIAASDLSALSDHDGVLREQEELIQKTARTFMNKKNIFPIFSKISAASGNQLIVQMLGWVFDKEKDGKIIGGISWKIFFEPRTFHQTETEFSVILDGNKRPLYFPPFVTSQEIQKISQSIPKEISSDSFALSIPFRDEEFIVGIAGQSENPFFKKAGITILNFKASRKALNFLVSTLNKTLIFLIIICFLIVCGTSVWTTIALVNPIKAVIHAVTENAREVKDHSAVLLTSSESVRIKANATEEISTSFNTIASTSEEISVNISNILSTAEQMSRSMTTVAGTIEEVSKSINNVSNNAKEASKVGDQAMKMADNATDKINSLGAAAREIGKVTEVIKHIAEQTNLLALNATIEAASAGEAGKGFAVVAHEIKELANQSAQAAEGIANKISSIQSNTNEAIKVITEVSGIIRTIHESVGQIREAMERQTSATNDISINASEIAKGTKNITVTIAEISKGATDMSQVIGQSAKNVTDLSLNIKMASEALEKNSGNIHAMDQSAEKLQMISQNLHMLLENAKKRD